MKKITVFNGVINGEKFDNVAAYNQRMTELIARGATNIEASSSTSIKTVEDKERECDAPAEPEVLNDKYNELELYPYIDDDTPYLDELVTIDAQRNANILKELAQVLSYSKNKIFEWLHDPEVGADYKAQYINNVQDVINRIKQDSKNNITCIDIVNSNRQRIVNDVQAAKARFEELFRTNDNERFMLTSAKPVIDNLLEFYKDVQAEGITVMSASNRNEAVTGEHCATNTCRCSQERNDNTGVVCDTREVMPQQIGDVTEWFNKILEDCGLIGLR